MEAGNGATKDLVYVVGTYPLLTTTFIDREIQTLGRWGLNVHVVAVRRPPTSPPLSDEQRRLQRKVAYLLPVRWVSLVWSHLSFLVRHPGRFGGTLAYLVTRPHPTLRSRLKTVLHFGEGVYVAYMVRNRSFREFHAHFADRAATIALVASRLLATSYSLSIHASADIFVDPVLLREKVMGARRVVTCTAHNKARVVSLVGDDATERIVHVRHGLDLEAFPDASGPASTTSIILSVGQLKERKGQALLIGACAILRDRGFQFNCRIVGRGPQYPELRSMIRRLELAGTVTLCGALRHEDVIREYQRASMFVLPCIQTGDGDVDGIPNVLAEAMALRVPIVSTRLPAIQELVSDGSDGLLVPPGDAVSIAEAMALLLDRPDLRARVGERGHRTVLKTFQVEPNVRAFGSTLWPEWFQPEKVSLGP